MLEVRRRSKVVIAAAIVAAAVTTLVVVLVNDERAGDQSVQGEGAGQVTTRGELVVPRPSEPTDPPSESTPESTPASTPADTPADTSPEDPGGDNAPSGPGADEVGVLVGSAGGLYPGAVVQLPLVLVNPHGFPISIETTTVNATGTAGCPGRMLRLDHPRGLSRRLAPGSSTPTALAVRMGKEAPDACQGVRFAVRVHVTVVRS